ncbi:hypothetical protein GCM10011594_32600 [Nakamurella endophytica]|uniref:Fibronectin type-III domain-containing protein n=1 Tax=Nakamurella endophytica TaxID=1748367 RepID=A0A917T429_9ACTN|nr:hypothetical protein GCM10011594_32600 [Nakamurella endophytica]
MGGLQNGTAYTFSVRAGNTVGLSDPSAASPPVIPQAPGSAPLLPRTVPSGQVGIRYAGSVAATAGSKPVRYRFASGALPPGLQLDTGAGALTGTPTRAGRFVFGVRASNSAGSVSRAFAVTVAGVPSAVPSAPRAVRVAGGHRSVTIGFIPPASAGGGGQIRGYQLSLDAGRTWQSVRAAGSASLRAVIGGLDSVGVYHLALRAVNAAGVGASVRFDGPAGR